MTDRDRKAKHGMRRAPRLHFGGGLVQKKKTLEDSGNRGLGGGRRGGARGARRGGGESAGIRNGPPLRSERRLRVLCRALDPSLCLGLMANRIPPDQTLVVQGVPEDKRGLVQDAIQIQSMSESVVLQSQRSTLMGPVMFVPDRTPGTEPRFLCFANYRYASNRRPLLGSGGLGVRV